MPELDETSLMARMQEVARQNYAELKAYQEALPTLQANAQNTAGLFSTWEAFSEVAQDLSDTLLSANPRKGPSPTMGAKADLAGGSAQPLTEPLRPTRGKGSEFDPHYTP